MTSTQPRSAKVMKTSDHGTRLPSLSTVDHHLRELKNRLGDMGTDPGSSGVVAGLFAELYSTVRWGKDGTPSWAVFVEAEGLRVEDLTPGLDDAAVRGFACALVDARLPRRAVASVLGVTHTTINNYYAAAGERPSQVPLRSARKVRAGSRREYARSVVAGVVAEVSAADPAVPGDFLIQAGAALSDAVRFVEEFVGDMGSGASLGVKDEVRVQRLSRDAQALLRKLSVADPGSGVRG
ncbi:hypothetical protein ABH924_003778 [Arthrobacter sp. GAS37]|uniref:hypothetical protein n=1 Tax=Arthrobacter sp. GAS37 TaxID=3156261 RepID=UPI0038330A1E